MAIKNKVSEEKIGVAAFCKCGGIIYCCTDSFYNEQGGKEKIDFYFDEGYEVGRVSTADVSKNWGCKCKNEN